MPKKKHLPPTSPAIPTHPKGDFLDQQPTPRTQGTFAGLGLLATGVAIASGLTLGASGEARPAAQESPQTAFDARKQEVHLVADRYRDCIVDGKVTLTPSKKSTGKRSRLDTLSFTIKTTRDEASQAVETKYADDDTIAWESAPAAFIVEKDQDGKPKLGTFVDNNGPDFLPSRIEKESNRVRLYPETDYPDGTEMAVFAGTHAETADYDFRKAYTELVATQCATLRLTHTPDGQRSWQVDPEGPVFPDIHKATNYDLVQAPGSSPGVYSRQIAQ